MSALSDSSIEDRLSVRQEQGIEILPEEFGARSEGRGEQDGRGSTEVGECMYCDSSELQEPVNSSHTFSIEQGDEGIQTVDESTQCDEQGMSKTQWTYS